MDVKKKISSVENSLRNEKLEGIYFGPFTSNYARIIISSIAGFLITFVLFAADVLLESNLLNTGYWFLVGILFSIIIGWNEEKVTIPVNHVGFITFLGQRVKVYLTEGSYYWIGKSIFCGISRTPIPNAKNVAVGEGEEQGFVYIGTRNLQIWDSRETRNNSLSLPARGGSTVKTNFTLKISTFDPMLWASSDDPILQIAEQARAGLRKALTFFRDIDVSGAKSAVVSILRGNKVVTIFTNKQFESHLVGTMVQDLSGFPLYEVVDINQMEGEPDAIFAQREIQELEIKKAQFIIKALANGNPGMISASLDREGNLVTAVLQVEEKLNTVVENNVGARIENIVISDTQLSDTVRVASEIASSKSQQRDQQIISAQTQAEVMAILAEAKGKLGGSELELILAALGRGDKGININHVTGTNSNLIKAASLVAAAQKKGGNE